MTDLHDIVDSIDSQWPRGGSRESTIDDMVRDLLTKQIISGPDAETVLRDAFEAAWPPLPAPGVPVDWKTRPSRVDVIESVAATVRDAGLSVATRPSIVR